MPDNPDNLIAELFPEGVATALSYALPAHAELLPSEIPGTEAMIESRLQEFIHGRYCARQAMNRLSAEPCAIPKAEDRSPIWPDPLVGTITHSGPFAAAAVAYSSEFLGVGLDLETTAPLSQDIRRMVCREDETPRDMDEAKLFFVCKEAIYKCIYPQVGRYVDFREMELILDSVNHRFSAVAHSENFDTSVVKTLEGRFVISQDLMLASAWIAA